MTQCQPRPPAPSAQAVCRAAEALSPRPESQQLVGRHITHLFAAHFGQFIQINVDAVELDPIGRPTLRVQDLLHQHVEEARDAAEETTRAGVWARRRPCPCGGDVAHGVADPVLPSAGAWHMVCAAARAAAADRERGDRGTRCALRPATWVQLSCSSTGLQVLWAEGHSAEREASRTCRLTAGLESTLSHCRF